MHFIHKILLLKITDEQNIALYFKKCNFKFSINKKNQLRVWKITKTNCKNVCLNLLQKCTDIF